MGKMFRRYPMKADLRAEALALEEQLALWREVKEKNSRPEAIRARREALVQSANERARIRRAYTSDDEEVARVAKAISHPARVKILRLLEPGPSRSCDEIVREMPIAQATVSQHLKVLSAAGLIRGRRDSLRVYYSVRPAGLDGARRLLRRL